MSAIHPGAYSEPGEISFLDGGSGPNAWPVGICGSVQVGQGRRADDRLAVDLAAMGVHGGPSDTISATLALIEPAGPTLVMSRNGITRTFPSCSS